ncbi:helix-hairpin-helix domain-containing protein [Micromonospora sp. MA102]|uniref:helix-hairpin-helix domain-containing protein n=1 Tax=Micromonospora sp. MA102 TaxID=2952755 RepID=UPI0021CA1F0F|nr:helix-hairpin-helix domain-containing protein [Micromonospora sp. MA102]
MPSSFGQWLVLILALLVGLVIGWVVSGRRNTAGTGTPTVEGAAAPAPEVTATVDRERPEAVVDEVPAPAAVTEAPAPADQDAAPAAATLAAEATPLPSTEPVTVTEPAASDEVPARTVAAEPVAEEGQPVAVPAPRAADEEAEPARTAPEPVAVAEEPAAAAEPAADEPVATEPVADEPVADEPVAPVTVPAPRAAVEDAAPAQVDAADDFRRIQGIGPKLAAALQAAGIRTYQQLSELDEATLRETVKAAGLRAAPGLATWSQQAKVLAGARAEAERVLPAGAGEGA